MERPWNPTASRKRMPARPCRTEIAGDSRKIYQAVANGVDNQFGSLVDAQGVHDIGPMNRHGVRAQIEEGGDLLVGLSIHDHLQNFEFARGQMFVALPLERGRTRKLRI